MRITTLDIAVLILGLTAAILGNVCDMHGVSFLGGSLCGAFAFNMGWKFEEWSGGK